MRNVTHFFGAALFFLVMTCIGTSATLGAAAYELTIVPPGLSSSPEIYRLDVASGSVAYVSGNNYAATSDPQPVPPSTYRLYTTVSGDNKGTYWLYRLDMQSGRTWFLSSGVWHEILPAK
jgi:hypothetical protein